MMLANGLGGGVYMYYPLLRYFVPRGWRVITWDYRGLFGSSSPDRPRRLAIPESAEDACELLDAIDVQRVDAFVGWSTGVQVGLELAALHPERVGRLVLLGGTHGKVFSTAFQPLFRIPFVHDMLHWLMYTLSDNLSLLKRAADLMWPFHFILSWVWLRWYSIATNNPALEECFLQYLHDVFGRGLQHTRNYLRTFLELDAHSCYHCLRDIENPTLILSGFLDVLTPAYNSFEMASKLKNGIHKCFFLGTHALVMEYPVEVVEDVANFVYAKPPYAWRFERRGDDKFDRIGSGSGIAPAE